MRLGILRRESNGFFRGWGPIGKRMRIARGNTLPEIMITTVVVAVAALGGLSYEYLSAKHTKIAISQMTATRTARLLLEDWKSTGGSAEYNPSRLGLGFSGVSLFPASLAIPAELDGMASGGAYSAKSDGLPMVIALRYKDVAIDLSADVKLRQLSILVSFGEAVHGQLVRSSRWLETIPPITLTTFVRTDGSSG